jgi:two-component system nitrate/nitrite response regulator NarL
MHSDRLLPADPLDPNLSAREEEILRYIGEGYPNKIIARKLGIMEGTVKVHVKAILRKARVGNRTQAAIWFMNNPALTRTYIPPLSSVPQTSEATLAAGADVTN